MSNLVYFLALNSMTGIGSKTILRLREKWPDLATLFDSAAPELQQQGLPMVLAEAIAGFDFTAIERERQWAEQDNAHLLTIDDVHYPALLREIPSPPIVLYAYGDPSALQQPTLAVVGSRKPSVQGAENAFRFARDLAAAGVTIVSGLALGIDAQAHLGCLNAKGRTIAVLGTGMNHIYPRRHQGLAREISQKGLLLSEFPLQTRPFAGHFPRRNRIISGLSLATLVVEAATKSGSLITARLALEQNRDVLAIPGSIHNPMARGCHVLLQQGAKLVSKVEDILEELPIHSTKNISPGNNPQAELASDAQKLVQCMGFDPSSVDDISRRCGLDINQTMAKLTELELEGIIQAVAGGYIRCNA
ncbi:MAG: DNA-processing protein DprA [Legionellaceae bacterium]|nr:DNA-processing protein DprA [Legionellaceae bacterium]